MGPVQAARDYLALFDRRIRLLAWGQLANTLGRGSAMPFLGVYIYSKGFALVDVAAGYAAFSLAAVACGLLAGAAADRFGRKPVMLASLGGSSLALLSFALVDTRATYLLASACAGGFGALYGPAARAMVADVTPRPRRARAYGLLYLASNLGFALGVAVGGLVAARSFLAVFMGASAGAGAFFLVVLLTVPETRPRRIGTFSESARAMLDWRTPLTDRTFLLFVAIDILFSLGWGLFNSYLPIYVTETLAMSTAHVGLLFALNGALVVLLQVPASALAERQPRARMLVLAAISLGVAFFTYWAAGNLVVGVAAGFAVLLLAMTVQTVSEMLRSPVQPALVADLAHVDHTGKYMSFLDLSHALGAAGGALAAARLFDMGRPHLVWPAFAALMVPAILGLLAIGATLALRSSPEPEAPRSPDPSNTGRR